MSFEDSNIAHKTILLPRPFKDFPQGFGIKVILQNRISIDQVLKDEEFCRWLKRETKEWGCVVMTPTNFVPPVRGWTQIDAKFPLTWHTHQGVGMVLTLGDSTIGRDTNTQVAPSRTIWSGLQQAAQERLDTLGDDTTAIDYEMCQKIIASPVPSTALINDMRIPGQNLPDQEELFQRFIWLHRRALETSLDQVVNYQWEANSTLAFDTRGYRDEKSRIPHSRTLHARLFDDTQHTPNGELLYYHPILGGD